MVIESGSTTPTATIAVRSRAEPAEAFTRNFELDFRDAQVSLKSSLNYKDVELSEQLIDNVIQPALVAFNEFFPALPK